MLYEVNFAAQVTAWSPLDFDHISPKIGEQTGCRGTGQILGEVEDFDPSK
jgi:hypothetical protein